jgi:hypothetical protein
MNNQTNKDYLVSAGLLYESLDMNDKAKDAYDLYIARGFSNTEVSVRLAKIEILNNNCKRAVELIRGIDTNSVYGTDVKKVYEQCKSEHRQVVITKNDPAQKGWAAVFAWRLGSAAITLAGAGIGYYFNMQYEDNGKKYTDEKFKPNVESLHSDLDTYKKIRNLSYLGGAVGLASLSASIALPIISRK